jgi:Ras-related protein Rab-5C
LGAVYFEKIVTLVGRKIKFEFWDTAGQEKYKAIARIYYKDCRVALVVYDVG